MMENKCLLGEDCDMTLAYMKGFSDGKAAAYFRVVSVNCTCGNTIKVSKTAQGNNIERGKYGAFWPAAAEGKENE